MKGQIDKETAMQLNEQMAGAGRDGTDAVKRSERFSFSWKIEIHN
jgi:hypothetical protein